jgi:hypothetical protein
MFDHSIVETDNLGGDYPDEAFVIRNLTKDTAEQIADLINKEKCIGPFATRYWKVVEDSYKKPYQLIPGFEP